ncbi:hypothetical protein ACIRL0_16910 [Streptomyces sp. NPDC102365]
MTRTAITRATTTSVGWPDISSGFAQEVRMTAVRGAAATEL